MGNPITRTAAWLFTLAALASTLTWVGARLLSDRLEWSQYLFWLPTPAALLFIALLLLTSSALARLARGLSAQDRIGARPPAARTRRIAWAGWVGVLAWMLIGEWHAVRYIAPVQTPDGVPHLRVMYWNPVDADNFGANVFSQSPDVLVVANAPRRADWVVVREAMGGQTYTVRYDRFTIVSRFPVLRWAAGSLDIKGARPRSFIFRGGGYVVQDTGQAVFAELDTTEVFGRPMVVWGVDLPSDFNLSRWVVMRQAAATLAATKGPAYRRTRDGMDQPEPLDGFPQPDVIVGDFNTPRGSASLEELSGNMSHAFDQAGRGFAATWPRQWPVFAIDQAFVGPDFRATMYRVVDFGEGKHRAEVFDLIARE